MIVRVDDFPCGNEAGKREFDAMEALETFRDALRAPFLLAVVFGPNHVQRAEFDAIQDMDDVLIGAHGEGHKRLRDTSDAELRAMRMLLPDHAVMVPPYNALDTPTCERLWKAGFEFACTGPETRRDCPDIAFDGIREVPSVFYGTAWRFVKEAPKLGETDCLTLHLTWERRGGKDYEGSEDLGAVRALGEHFGDQIVSWETLWESG